MRHEQFFPAKRPPQAYRIAHPAAASHQLVSPDRRGLPNAEATPVGGMPATPLSSPRTPVRKQYPGCAWACTHCTVECSSATGIMRDLVRERAVIVADAVGEAAPSHPAELAELNRQIATMKIWIDEVRGKAWRAEFGDVGARRATKRAGRRCKPGVVN